jgi:hypothetical protein
MLHLQEALNLVTPAMQLAGKIPDVHVQLWASSLLKGKSSIFNLYSTTLKILIKARPLVHFVLNALIMIMLYYPSLGKLCNGRPL